MAKRVYLFSKRGGSISDSQEIHSMLGMWFDTISNGEYVLTVERVQKPRSNPQNRLMWMWFTCIAQAWSEATGRVFTRENVHDAYCQMFLPVNLPNGQHLPGSTSKLSVDAFTEFLNKVRADAAAEYGIQLPDPEDEIFAQFAKDFGYGA
ncbi:MAG: hypothetical protein ACI30J_08185 [Paludibacteraceae bacterium]